MNRIPNLNLLSKQGASLVAQMVTNPPAMQETWVQSLSQEDRWRRKATHSSILAREFHGQRSLAGYSPQGPKESDLIEQHTHTHIHTNTSKASSPRSPKTDNNTNKNQVWTLRTSENDTH